MNTPTKNYYIKGLRINKKNLYKLVSEHRTLPPIERTNLYYTGMSKKVRFICFIQWIDLMTLCSKATLKYDYDEGMFNLIFRNGYLVESSPIKLTFDDLRKYGMFK